MKREQGAFGMLAMNYMRLNLLTDSKGGAERSFVMESSGVGKICTVNLEVAIRRLIVAWKTFLPPGEDVDGYIVVKCEVTRQIRCMRTTPTDGWWELPADYEYT